MPEPVPPWRWYLGEVQRQIATGIPYTPAELLNTFLMHFLRTEASERGEKRLYRLSLTMPSWERNPERIRRAAQALAQGIATEPGCGAWLALDVSKKGEEHLYGVALSEQSSAKLITRWIEITGASELGCRVRPVSGQKEGWGEGRTEQTRNKLSENLSRVLHYSLKSLPPRYHMTLAERVIVTGCLQIPWERALEALQPTTRPSSQAPANPPMQAGRCCQHCGRRIVSTKRRHARWCSSGCRTLAYAARRDLRTRLSEDELEAFEERAAIIEFDAGMTRPRAEQLAYDQRQLAAAAAVPEALPLTRRPQGPV
jgi:hypothetical protein